MQPMKGDDMNEKPGHKESQMEIRTPLAHNLKIKKIVESTGASQHTSKCLGETQLSCKLSSENSRQSRTILLTLQCRARGGIAIINVHGESAIVVIKKREHQNSVGLN